jgi:hypothetical protein
MNCDQIERRLAEYLDRSLDVATNKAIEVHLSTCRHCRAEADLLAECVRQVASLAQVEPPIGFAQRIIAHVKEIETRPNFWEGLFLAFKISIPSQAAALVVVGVIAVYIVTQESHRRVIMPWPRTFSLGGTRQETASNRAPNKTPALGSETAMLAPEPMAEGVEAPVVGSEQERGRDFRPAQTEPLRSAATEKEIYSAAVPPRQEPRLSPRAAPRIAAAPTVTHPEIPASSDRLDQAPQKAKVTPAIPVVSDPKALSRPRGPAAPAPLDLLELMGAGQPGPPLASELQTLSTAPDVELVVRRRGQSSKQHVAMQKSAVGGTTGAAEAAGKSIDRPFLKLPENATRHAVLLSIPQNQYDRIKSDLLAIGTIESESRHGSAEAENAPITDRQLRVLIIILPPDYVGADRPGLPSR